MGPSLETSKKITQDELDRINPNETIRQVLKIGRVRVLSNGIIQGYCEFKKEYTRVSRIYGAVETQEDFNKLTQIVNQSNKMVSWLNENKIMVTVDSFHNHYLSFQRMIERANHMKNKNLVDLPGELLKWDLNEKMVDLFFRHVYDYKIKEMLKFNSKAPLIREPMKMRPNVVDQAAVMDEKAIKEKYGIPGLKIDKVLNVDISLTDHKRPINTLTVFDGDIDLKNGFMEGFKVTESERLSRSIERGIIELIERSIKINNEDNGKNGDIIEIGVIYSLGGSFGGRYCPDKDRIRINIKDYPKMVNENDCIDPIIQSIKESLIQDLEWNGKLILKITEP